MSGRANACRAQSSGVDRVGFGEKSLHPLPATSTMSAHWLGRTLPGSTSFWNMSRLLIKVFPCLIASKLTSILSIGTQWTTLLVITVDWSSKGPLHVCMLDTFGTAACSADHHKRKDQVDIYIYIHIFITHITRITHCPCKVTKQISPNVQVGGT